MIMEVRKGIFAGDDPFVIARRWLDEATQTEVNDPNAIALSTVDADGLPKKKARRRTHITSRVRSKAGWGPGPLTNRPL